VNLEILRRDQRLTLRVAVAERETDPGRLSEFASQENAARALGVIAIELTPRIAALLPPLRRTSAAIVARVSPDTPYSQQGRLRPGDAIYAVNTKTITGIADLKAAVAELKPGAAAVLQIEREGGLMYISFRVER
jgi:S1-C subfamily serine protease